jgi:serine protease DegQ
VTSGAAIRQVSADEPVTRVNALGSYADAAKHALPAVVNIYTVKQIRRGGGGDESADRTQLLEEPGGDPQAIARLGSGVIATGDGYVLTNNHVVQAADEIAVALGDGRRVQARLVGADPETDLAVLKVDLTDLPAITFGRSETLRVGDVVLAIGNPYDVGQTVTMGIVSALGRSNLGLNTFENFIQTDAAINEGNSGGALVDSDGHLIGINTAIFSRSGGSVGIGFAIPTTIITQVMDQIVRNGRVRRGYFGIEPSDITPELVDAFRLKRAGGVVVRGFSPNAPAVRAGMELGDIVMSINGAAVTDRRSMLSQIAQLEPGARAAVRVLRDGKEVDLSVSVGERPTPPSH